MRNRYANHRDEEISIILQTSRNIIKKYTNELSLESRPKTALLAKAHSGEGLEENLFIQTCNNFKMDIDILIRDLSCINYPDMLIFLQQQDKFLWLCVYDCLGVSKLLRKFRIDAKRINWNLVDTFLTEKINSAINEMLNSGSFPVRISTNTIENHFGFTRIQRRNLKNMPIALSTIKNSSESPLEFNFRKIRWGYNLFLSKKIFPSKAYFKKTCHIVDKDDEITLLIDKNLADLAAILASKKFRNPDGSTSPDNRPSL